MANLHVGDLKSQVGAYARSYMFQIYFTGDNVNVGTGSTATPVYLVRSTSLPAGTVSAIEVPWQGQTYKIGGTHEFEDWSCTFNVDKDATIRKELLNWQASIHNPSNNKHGSPEDYFGKINLELLDPTSQDASPILTYTLYQAWPSSVDAIDLDYSNKEVAQFSATFKYNWYETDR